MKKIYNMLNNRKGFTLIELIVVIAIIGILAAVTIPKFTGFQDKAKRTQVVTDSKQLATAIDTLLIENNGTLTDTTGLESAANTYAEITSNEAVVLSGIDASHITLLTINSNGTFTFAEVIGNKTYTVTRTAVGAPPTISQ